MQLTAYSSLVLCAAYVTNWVIQARIVEYYIDRTGAERFSLILRPMNKATTKKPKQKAVEGLPVINLHAAGIDVAASSHMVALPPGTTQSTLR